MLVVWVGGFGWVGGRVIGWVVDGWERLLPLRLPGQLERRGGGMFGLGLGWTAVFLGLVLGGRVCLILGWVSVVG